MPESPKKAFSLIELVVILAVLSILALIAVPKFLGYTKQAEQTRLTHDAKLLENASQTYYLAYGDWPRASDTPYTADQVAAFADKVYDQSGRVVVLDPTGNYYDVDMTKLASYLTLKDDSKNFIIQNPVGSIYLLDKKSNKRLTTSSPVPPAPAATPTKPVAVIGMTPSTNITTTTTITWDASGSYDTNTGGTIVATNWTGQQATYATPGTYTVSLTVQNNQGIWSDPVSVTFSVINGQGVKQIAAGWGHTVILLNDGTVKTWGDNAKGQLGMGDTTQRTTPTAVPGLTNVTQIAVGQYHTVALLSDGTLRAWGQNSAGELGNGATTNQYTTYPVVVASISNVKAISAGYDHTLALLNDGSVMAWGANSWGQIGVGSTATANYYVPTAVPGLTGVQMIQAGGNHSFVVMSDGSVKTWGMNNKGQLGLNNTATTTSPTLVPGLTNVQQIAIGYTHSLALLNDGSVKAWGNNLYGQLGLGNTTDKLVPTTVSGLTGVQRLKAGFGHTVALLSDGTLKTWGQNTVGQLGLGNTTQMTSPTVVSGLTSIQQITSGYNHVFALATDGSAKAWGGNGTGQLGIGNTTNQTSPVMVVLQ